MTDIFAAMTKPEFRYRWRHVLVSHAYAKPETRELCQHYDEGQKRWVPGTLVLDSSFTNLDVTNEMLVRKAREVGADVLVPKDYVRDWKHTVASVKHFLTLGWEKQVLVPLQPPYNKCFAELEDCGDWFGLGGLVGNKHKKTLIEAGIEMLAKAGKKCHLFGISPTGKLLQFVREHRDEIYSLDTSRPEFEAIAGRVLNVTGDWVHFPSLMGAGLAIVKGKMAELTLSMVDHVANFGGEIAKRSRKSNHLQFGSAKVNKKGEKVRQKRLFADV